MSMFLLFKDLFISGNVHYVRLRNANKAAHSGFETQRRHHQKSKTGVPVAPKMDMCPPNTLKKKFKKRFIFNCSNLENLLFLAHLAMPKWVYMIMICHCCCHWCCCWHLCLWTVSLLINFQDGCLWYNSLHLEAIAKNMSNYSDLLWVDLLLWWPPYI